MDYAAATREELINKLEEARLRIAELSEASAGLQGTELYAGTGKNYCTSSLERHNRRLAPHRRQW